MRRQRKRELYKRKRAWELEMIKRVPADEFLSWLGVPYKVYPKQVMTYAVWRVDRNPSVSCFVSYSEATWMWRDHGTGESGSWIDFYMRYTSCSYPDAVKELREAFVYTEENLLKKPKPKIPSPSQLREKPKLRIESITDLELLRWLSKNKITKIPSWLKQIAWTRRRVVRGLGPLAGEEVEDIFYGLGIPTMAGGWAVRTAIGKKLMFGRSHVSLLGEPKVDYIVVVEGLSDALVAFQLWEYPVLCMNSVMNIDKAVVVAKRLEVPNMIVALDKDPAGRQALAVFQKKLGWEKNIWVADWNKGKDLREAYLNNEEITIDFYPPQPNR